MSAKQIHTTKLGRSTNLVLAAVGVLVATGLFMQGRRTHQAEQLKGAMARLDAAEKLLAAHQALQAKHLLGAAEMLAGDQRIRQTVLDSLDEPTLVDTFTDMQTLDRKSLHALLTPKGRVAAVVGGPSLKGADLSSSSLVKAVLTSEGGVGSRWLLDGQLTEVAGAAVRQGNQLIAIVVVGDALDAKTLDGYAAAADVAIAFTSEGKVIKSAQAADDDAKALVALAAGQDVNTHVHRTVDVGTAMPPVKILLAAKVGKTEDPEVTLGWAALGAALLFAVLAVARGSR
ncbi:MAG: hypothetical protein K1X64_04450 [Myxococcaceae bacterium]|nr:hypothetical protein [Myxococcaceae bacterium]